MKRVITLLVALAALALVGPAMAGDMALTSDGFLVRLIGGEEGLDVLLTAPDGAQTMIPVPQTAGVPVSGFQLAVDEHNGTIVTVWQEADATDGRVVLASYAADSWFGPVVIAGHDGAGAINPRLVLQRAEATVENDDGVTSTIATTLAHLAWWDEPDVADGGHAVFATIPFHEDGTPDLEATHEVALRDLLGFGLAACEESADAAHLKQPQLVFDANEEVIRVLAADFANCVFLIATARPELIDWDPDNAKRGRHIIIFSKDRIAAMNRDVEMVKARVELGTDLSLVMRWDEDDSRISYTRLTDAGWGEIHSLDLGDALDHERAVDLIRSLAR